MNKTTVLLTQQNKKIKLQQRFQVTIKNTVCTKRNKIFLVAKVFRKNYK